MGKATKQVSATAKAKNAAAAVVPDLKKVKNAIVTKSAPKGKSLNGAVAKGVNGKEAKRAKKVESSDSEEDDSEENDSSEDDSEESDAEGSDDSSEDEKPAKKSATNGVKTNGAKPAADSEPEDSDESDSSEEDEAPKANGVARKAGDDDEDSESSDSSEEESDEEDAKPKTKTAAAAVKSKAKTDDSSEEEDDSEDASEDDDESSEDDEDDAEEAAAEEQPKKRKALDDPVVPAKKTKTEGAEGSTTIFAGSLAWAVNDQILYQAFEAYPGLANARVVTDRDSGRSRGFGYVDFNSHEEAKVALEALHGQEVEGRALNLDFASVRPNNESANPRARAQDRAKQHGDVTSPPSDTLFVGNLPFGVDQDAVHAFFAEVAEPVSVRLPTDMETGNPKGFGYVSFSSVEEAQKALEALNGSYVGEGGGGRAVRLDFSTPRPPREGGFGGGRGGGGGGFRGGRGAPRGGGFRGGSRGGPRGGGRGGGRGGFNNSRGGFSGTKVTF